MEAQSTKDVASAWEQDIRTAEETACKAFLDADLPVLEAMWDDGFTVNSPLQKVLNKSVVLSLLKDGRIRHTSFEFEIEHISRHGDVVVVMGRDTVTDPPDGARSLRRFTNVWKLVDGRWRAIARHANVVAREAG